MPFCQNIAGRIVKISGPRRTTKLLVFRAGSPVWLLSLFHTSSREQFTFLAVMLLTARPFGGGPYIVFRGREGSLLDELALSHAARFGRTATSAVSFLVAEGGRGLLGGERIVAVLGGGGRGVRVLLPH